MLGAALWLPVWTEMCQDSGLLEGYSRSHTRLYGDTLDTCRLARQAQRALQHSYRHQTKLCCSAAMP